MISQTNAMGWWCKRISATILFLCITFAGFAQRNTVRGTVTDEEGNPVVGAFVTVQGVSGGTSTDVDGRYQIDAPAGSTLVFSFIGFRTQQVPASNAANIVLVQDRTSLDESVVVAYGVQKKRDIVGAVENLSTKEIESRTGNTMNISRALQGTIPGLNLTFSDGKPNRDATVQIRGTVNSIGSGGSALVLIDGIEGDMNSVNPDDIESVTVLKDASSAAVYGSRGTFGVILLTTKSGGNSQPKVTYSNAFNIYTRTVKPQMVTNGLQWTTSFLEAYRARTTSDPANINNVFAFSRQWYENLKQWDQDKTTPNSERYDVNPANGRWRYYGNTSWYDIIFRDYTSGQTHNLTVSGGSDKANYFISGRFFTQNGIYNAGDEKFNQYNVRAKGSLKVRPWLKLDNNTDFTKRDSHQPLGFTGYGETPVNIFRMLNHQGYPMTLEKNPDGSWTEAAVYIGWAGFNDGNSWRNDNMFNLKNLSTLTVDLIKDVLVARANYAFYYENGNRSQVVVPYFSKNGPNLSEAKRPANSRYSEFPWTRQRQTADATLTFTPNLGPNNSLTVMGGWNIEDVVYKRNHFTRTELLMYDRPNWSLLNGEDMTLADGGSWDSALNGFFGRISYSYKGKYLAEISGRYDGNSRFPSNQRWGFFPSASFGWRISEEGFLKNAEWLDNLKLRFSAGTAGNGLISNAYAYMSTMSVTKSSVLSNGNTFSRTAAPAPIPDGLTWEKATTYDLGLDFEALNGRLNFVADVYRKATTDMYVSGDELPAVYGNAAPKGNYADMQTDGWEVSLGWRNSHSVGGHTLSYSIKGMVYDAMSKITRYTSKTNKLPSIYSTNYYEGMTIGEIWGHRIAGFITEADKAAGNIVPIVYKNSSWKQDVGDLQFIDLDGSGRVDYGDETLANHGDLVKIGNMTPRYNYSLNMNVNWNGIGLSMMWMGVGKRDWYPAKESGWFWGQYGRPYSMSMPWHSERAAIYDDTSTTLLSTNYDAYWPRLVSYITQGANNPYGRANDYFLQKASFLRLKNLTLDYTLPKKWVDAINFESIKFYISGDNLFTLTPLKKHAPNYDPEGLYPGDADWATNNVGGDNYGDGDGYPVMRVYTFGVNITF